MSLSVDLECPAIRYKHRWDNSKDKISATCIKCGCKRIAQKYGDVMGWVYVQRGDTVELKSVPSCGHGT